MNAPTVPSSRSSPTSGVPSPMSGCGRSRSGAHATAAPTWRSGSGHGRSSWSTARRWTPPSPREHADELREQVAPNLFRHLDIDRFPSSTLDALALANRAYRTDLQVGERVSFALRDALFEEGRDISDLGHARVPRTRSGRRHARRDRPRRRAGGLARRASGAASSGHRTSSAATTTCSALRSTSRRTPSRGCRSSGTPPA